MIENWRCAALLAKHFSIHIEVPTARAFNRYDRRNDNSVTWTVDGGLLFYGERQCPYRWAGLRAFLVLTQGLVVTLRALFRISASQDGMRMSLTAADDCSVQGEGSA
jgi:hypothetical protein